MADNEMRQMGIDLISDAEFNRHLLSTVEWASDYMVGEEEFPPHIFARYVNSDGEYEMSIMVTPGFEDGDQKSKIMIAMGVEAAKSDSFLAAVYLVTGAWMSRQISGEEKPDVQPSEDPNRAEVVVVAGITIDSRQNWATILVERDAAKLMAPGTVVSNPYIGDEADSIDNALLTKFMMGYCLGVLGKRAKHQ